jgi:hypothetical protein
MRPCHVARRLGPDSVGKNVALTLVRAGAVVTCETVIEGTQKRMMAVMPKADEPPLRVAVLSRDPARKNRLTQWVRDAGHEQSAGLSDASVVLSDGMDVETAVPVVALGVDSDEYAARLPRDASPEQIDAALRAVGRRTARYRTR